MRWDGNLLISGDKPYLANLDSYLKIHLADSDDINYMKSEDEISNKDFLGITDDMSEEQIKTIIETYRRLHGYE